MPRWGHSQATTPTATRPSRIPSGSDTRALGANYVGTFDATIDVGHITDASTDPVKTETLEAKMAVERKNVDSKFVHTLTFNLGVKDGATNYARKMIFEQVDGQKTQVKVTDILNPGTENEEQFASIVDVKAGTQHGAEIRLRGRGVPHLRRQGARGDLHVLVDVRIPTRLSARQRELPRLPGRRRVAHDLVPLGERAAG